MLGPRIARTTFSILFVVAEKTSLLGQSTHRLKSMVRLPDPPQQIKKSGYARPSQYEAAIDYHNFW